MELEWPVTKCEACDYDLREKTPRENEKSNDSSGRLKWTDFCPKCGYGYFVGDRVLPTPTADILAEIANQPVIGKQPIDALASFDPEHQVTPGEVATGEPSGIPPDERGADLAEKLDPEGLLNNEPESPPEEKPEPGSIRPPGEGEYFCTKCASNHKETSGVGKRHKKYAE